MNRVKKISRKYGHAKPEIDHLRMIRTHTRRMHRASKKALHTQKAIAEYKEQLASLSSKELKKLASEANIKGRSKMNKGQLVDALSRV